MASPDRIPAERRLSVEALAQALYEASDPDGAPWARRARVIREAWLMVADEQISTAERSAAADAREEKGRSGG
jgi:hypothetical protein